MMSGRRVACAVLLLAVLSCRGRETEPPGLVVERAAPGGTAARAGLREGDVLLEADGVPLSSAFDIDELEREQAGRRVVTVRARRGAATIDVPLPMGAWELRARPPMTARDGTLYAGGPTAWSELASRFRAAGQWERTAWLHREVARTAARENDWKRAEAAVVLAREAARRSGAGKAIASVEEAVGLLREANSEPALAIAAYEAAMAADDPGPPGSLRQSWRLTRWAAVAISQGRLDEAQERLERARAMAEQVEPRSLERAAAWNALGGVALYGGDLPAALALMERALALRQELAPDGLEVATSLNNLCAAKRLLGDLDAAHALQSRALKIRERLAPDGRDMAQSLSNLGAIAAYRSDLEAAEGYYRRALAIESRLAPGRLGEATTLSDLGAVASRRGRIAEAEDCYQRALAVYDVLAPESRHVGLTLNNMGIDALVQGRVALAEERLRRALGIFERLEPEGAEVGMVLDNLGDAAMERKDLAAAHDFYRRALAQTEHVAPDALSTASALTSLGRVFLARDEVKEARRALSRALTIQRKAAPQSLDRAMTLHILGDVARHERRWSDAWALYRQGRELRRQLAPGSVDEAESLHGLASLAREQGRRGEALGFYREMLAAFEMQRTAIAGSDQTRITFARRYEDYYRETLRFLMEERRAEEAFAVLERYRARALLALFAERDLTFSADIPPALDGERRQADAAYDRLQSELLNADGTRIRQAQAELGRARQRREAVRDRIRVHSPRLAALQYPQPLSLPQVREVLDPGTLLVSYSIGPAESHVFAVGPGPLDFLAQRLDIDREGVRAAADALRRALREDGAPAALKASVDGLSRSLLGPLEGLIGRARRLVVVPDGPLHLVPFAMLAAPGPGAQAYLVERAPLHVVASATVFAELKKRRRAASHPRTLVAFGDPDYSAVPRRAGFADEPQSPFRSLRGIDLGPLPAARREVETLGRLFERAQVFVGAAATEERAKALGTEAALIHFACHGLANETAPLESTLALSIPGRVEGEQDNGLLQAWEILEQVRIDADLVTLSACNTALGPEMSGEGLLGFTRAFHHAGARSLLASLWEVSDLSTGDLMERFYSHLRDGRTKDEALRAAQIEMIRGGTFAHPARWAAFQIMGDWQ